MLQPSRTILIVDDSPEDRELYRRYLLRDREYSYTALEANLGRQGLDLWQQYQPDVVLLDYRLPDLDGVEFLAQLQSLGQQTCLPVIMVTGQGNEAIAVRAMKAGAQDYLVKEQITPEGLHLAVNGAVETVQLRAQLQQRIERQRLVAQITQHIHQSLELEKILQTTVNEVRQFLQTDRVLIFRLQPDGSGTVITESVGSEWTPLLSTSLYDPCFKENYIESFRQGLVTIKPDIYDGSITPCHVELLARLQVRANLVVPILQDHQLWGMLIAHHCATTRQWEALEVELLKELATQLGIALQQAELYQQAQSELTERRRVEAELRQSEEFKSRILESSSDCIKLLNLDGQILYMNPGAMRLLEIEDVTAYINTDWASFWQDDSRKAVESAIATAKTGETSRFQGFCLTAKGTPKWWDVVVTPIFNANGQVVQILATSRDITERQQAEQERAYLLEQEQAARAEAERANRIKDEFLAVLSHELRSPLNPILGWSKLLQTRRFTPTTTAEALATIERNAKLQAQLIDDLLDVAKILRGKLSINVAPVSLVFAIKSALETVRATAVAKSIHLHPVLPQIGQVSGDAVRLQQIVWNLLSNAIKFTPTHGQVDIQLSLVTVDSYPEEARRRGDAETVQGAEAESITPYTLHPTPYTQYAQIQVKDTGKGINPDFLPYIFESFRQEDTSTTRKFGGLGLGLAIVRYLVEAHGGTIWAESNGEGQGTTFTVRLPLLDSEPELHHSEKLSKHELDLTGIRVLCVDDEPDTRQLLTSLLTQYGASVLTVASATEVLANLESFEPDILVSDIGMPEIDGYTLIKQIRTLPPEKGGQIPAIALTAYAKEDDRQLALNSGYQCYIIKPLEPEQLVRSIMSLINNL